MKKSTQGILPLPKGNWIYPFYEFKDIVRSLEAVFGVNANLNQKRELSLLRGEIIDNLSILLLSCDGELYPKCSFWGSGAYSAYQRIRGGLQDQTQMQRKEFDRLFIFTIVGSGHGISNQHIKKSILDGTFLAYDNSTHSYLKTPFHLALARLNTYLERLEFMLSQYVNEEVAKIHTRSEQLKHRYGDSDIVSIDNSLLTVPFGLCLIQNNAVLILKALLNYIDGDGNALDFYEKQLVSTFVFSSKEDIEKDESVKPTISQIEIWAKQKTM